MSNEQVNTPVKRYMPNPSAGASLSPGSYMFPSDSGVWVKHTDYALMESRALAAEAKVPKWQPMETAPKDGTRVLANLPNVYGPEIIWFVYGSGWYCASGHLEHYEVTAWMTLPTPPKEDK